MLPFAVWIIYREESGLLSPPVSNPWFLWTWTICTENRMKTGKRQTEPRIVRILLPDDCQLKISLDPFLPDVAFVQCNSTVRFMYHTLKYSYIFGQLSRYSAVTSIWRVMSPVIRHYLYLDQEVVSFMKIISTPFHNTIYIFIIDCSDLPCIYFNLTGNNNYITEIVEGSS